MRDEAAHVCGVNAERGEDLGPCDSRGVQSGCFYGADATVEAPVLAGCDAGRWTEWAEEEGEESDVVRHAFGLFSPFEFGGQHGRAGAGDEGPAS